MTRDHHDFLIDQLLREILGGDRPRDITTRVLEQARIYDRFRRRLWVSAGAALAASIALGITLFSLWPREGSYPEPVAENVLVEGTPRIQPGVRIATEDQDGRLKLGGYVDVTIGPQSALTLGGSKYQEKVFLDSGQLDVKVTKNKGKFDVAVGPAIVHVTGTQFAVNVENDVDPTQMRRVKRLIVDVAEGSVDVQNVPTPMTLKSGERQEFEIASEPILVNPTPNLATRPAQDAQAANLLGMGTGSRIGNRGQARPANLDALKQALGRGQGTGARGAAVAAGDFDFKPLKYVVTSEKIERAGVVQQEHGLYFLQTPAGDLYLGPVAGSKWDLQAGRAYHVVWNEGEVVNVSRRN